MTSFQMTLDRSMTNPPSVTSMRFLIWNQTDEQIFCMYGGEEEYYTNYLGRKNTDFLFYNISF